MLSATRSFWVCGAAASLLWGYHKNNVPQSSELNQQAAARQQLRISGTREPEAPGLHRATQEGLRSVRASVEAWCWPGAGSRRACFAVHTLQRGQARPNAAPCRYVADSTMQRQHHADTLQTAPCRYVADRRRSITGCCREHSSAADYHAVNSAACEAQQPPSQRTSRSYLAHPLPSPGAQSNASSLRCNTTRHPAGATHA
jgi:hypothetical protein